MKWWLRFTVIVLVASPLVVMIPALDSLAEQAKSSSGGAKQAPKSGGAVQSGGAVKQGGSGGKSGSRATGNSQGANQANRGHGKSSGSNVKNSGKKGRGSAGTQETTKDQETDEITPPPRGVPAIPRSSRSR